MSLTDILEQDLELEIIFNTLTAATITTCFVQRELAASCPDPLHLPARFLIRDDGESMWISVGYSCVLWRTFMRSTVGVLPETFEERDMLERDKGELIAPSNREIVTTILQWIDDGRLTPA